MWDSDHSLATNPNRSIFIFNYADIGSNLLGTYENSKAITIVETI